MQVKHYLSVAIATFITFFIPPAFAIMSVPYGWYVEANVGSTKIDGISYPGSSSTSGIGGSAAVGYKFMPFVGLELGFARYANSSITDPSTNTKAGTGKHYSYDVALRGILPMADSGFELLAKLGVGRAVSNTTISNTTAASNIGLSSGQHSMTGLYTSLGGQYYFTPEVAVVVQWARQAGSSSSGNLDLLSIGLNAIFD